MGTRRSKHNKGRKPRYKDNSAEVCKAIWETPDWKKEPAPTVEDVLAKPAFVEYAPGRRYRFNQRLNWSDADKMRLQVLAKAGISPTIAADTLGREEKTIAYKARDLGIYLPPEWSAYLPKPKYSTRPRERLVLLNYPFAIKATAENEEVLAVNKLVPKTWSDEMRADVCQELLLHIFQGKLNIETLKGPRGAELVRQYGRQWRNENIERGGRGLLRIPDLDDDRSYDEIASSIAARDWNWELMNDRRAAWEACNQTYTPPTQFHEVYEKELDKECLLRAERGEEYSREAVIADLERGGKRAAHRDLIEERVRIAKFVRECGFELNNALDLNPAYSGTGKGVLRCFGGANAAALQTQYVYFKIPGSAIRTLKIRIGDHAQKNDADLDTYKLGVDGVIRTLAELAGNLCKYEKVYDKWGGMCDLLNNGLEGFADAA